MKRAKIPTIHEKINIKSWFCSQRELPNSRIRIKRSDCYRRSDYCLERESPFSTSIKVSKVSKINMFISKF